MKKGTKNRPTGDKSMDSRASSSSAAANQDIVGLLTTLVQKLTSFEMKIDTVLNRIPPQPSQPIPQQPKPAHGFSFAANIILG